MEITLNYISVSISGDYYQVSFNSKKDNGGDELTDAPYFLIQRPFELPDGGKVYIESHDQNYIGHYRVNSATLQMDSFHLELRRPKNSSLEISFKATEKELKKLQRTLKTMIPCLNYTG